MTTIDLKDGVLQGIVNKIQVIGDNTHENTIGLDGGSGISVTSAGTVIIITNTDPAPAGSGTHTFVGIAGSTPLGDTIVVAEGSNVTLTQDGQTITIASSGGDVTGSISPIDSKYLVQWNTTNDTVDVWNGQAGTIVYSNTDELTAIQWALDNLTTPREYMEKVALRGSFNLDGSLTVGGYTYFDTSEARLFANNSIDTDMVRCQGTMFVVDGGYYVGNKGNQASGSAIRILPDCQRFWVKNMKIDQAKDYGVHIAGADGQTIGVGYFTDIIIEQCGSHGVLGESYSNDHVFSRINCGGNDGSGMVLSSSDANIIADCFFWNNGIQGLDIWGSDYNGIKGNRSDWNTEYGIRFGGGSTSNVALGNVMHSNVAGQVYNTAANIVRFNEGYVTETSGNTYITSGDTVDTGLDGIPSCVNLSCYGTEPVGMSWTTIGTHSSIIVYHTSEGQKTIFYRAFIEL